MRKVKGVSTLGQFEN